MAFFGRAADFEGFNFWLDEFDRGLIFGKTPKQLFADIASSFGISDEAKALYGFLQDPQHATSAQVGNFLDSVYENLFNRAPDPVGLAYWVDQINKTLASGSFVGNVLVDIIGGSQNSPAGNDITTLMNKVEVGIYYAQQVGTSGTEWTPADDKADAATLVHGVTDNPLTVLGGIVEAQALILADLEDAISLTGLAANLTLDLV